MRSAAVPIAFDEASSPVVVTPSATTPAFTLAVAPLPSVISPTARILTVSPLCSDASESPTCTNPKEMSPVERINTVSAVLAVPSPAVIVTKPLAAISTLALSSVVPTLPVAVISTVDAVISTVSPASEVTLPTVFITKAKSAPLLAVTPVVSKRDEPFKVKAFLDVTFSPLTVIEPLLADAPIVRLVALEVMEANSAAVISKPPVAVPKLMVWDVVLCEITTAPVAVTLFAVVPRAKASAVIVSPATLTSLLSVKVTVPVPALTSKSLAIADEASKLLIVILVLFADTKSTVLLDEVVAPSVTVKAPVLEI